MLCKPFKDASPNLITQVFGANPGPIQPNGHTGTDIRPLNPTVGTTLVAPCKVLIMTIAQNDKLQYNDDTEVQGGYGLVMKPLEGFPDNTRFLYWHTSPTFPVAVGDVVEQGYPVAEMSNSGYVSSGGQIVPVTARNAPPYAGKHVHFEYFTQGVDYSRQYMDVLPLIDWTIPVSDKGVFAAIAIMLQKIKDKLMKPIQ